MRGLFDAGLVARVGICAMRDEAYERLRRAEVRHWYFSARRAILGDVIARFLPGPIPGALNILDVGCGTGGTSDWLTRFGRVTAIDPAAAAIRHVREAYPRVDARAAAIDDLPAEVGDRTFDLITILTVLYHARVADPRAALLVVAQRLRPGGCLIWQEPAYVRLARLRDRHDGGVRRFNPGLMRRLAEAAGLEVRLVTPLFAWATPAVLALALFQRWAFRERDLEAMASDRLHRIFRALSSLEWFVGSHVVRLPFGVSCVLAATHR